MADPVAVSFLGGLGEIGRNCAAVEVGGKIMLIDCGLLFPDDDMAGVDLVLPDFTWIVENKDRLEGVIITHGHEDHMGGLAHLLREVPLKIISSELTLRLARNRIEEAGLVDRAEFVQVGDGERHQFGPFDCEFFPVTHSVPHGFATAFRTPKGVILHSGDFKLDLTPVDGRTTDLAGLGHLSREEGIALLLSDSTNADECGHSESETSVGSVLYDLFHAHEGRRIIVACFASHIHRVQQIADAAIAFDRTVVTLGRSMMKNVALAREMGILTIPDNRLRDISDLNDLDPAKVCIISTGSQGEPRSALALMAANDSKWLKIDDNDTVILSSHPIPGNESGVSRVMNGLVKMGAEIVHSGKSDVHASGHAKAEELKTYLSITEPKAFVPVHGEHLHLVAHAKLAETMGVDPKDILVCGDGDRVELTDKGIKRSGSVPAGYVYVHGSLDDIGRGLLEDRRTLGREGVVVITASVDIDKGQILAGPEVLSRGWVYEPDAGELLDDVADIAKDALLEALDKRGGKKEVDAYFLEQAMRRSVGKLVSDRTRRRPILLPAVITP
jgi:ribonuclease J